MTRDAVVLHSVPCRRTPRTVRCPLLIGRDDLLDLADRRLDDVLAGHGQFLLIAGQAGIGKTRFLGAIRPQGREPWLPEPSAARWRHRTTTSRPRRSSTSPASMVRMPAFAALGAALLELDGRCWRPSTPSVAGSWWRPSS